MDSSDLFSHPYEPQVAEKREALHEANGKPHFLGPRQKEVIFF